MEEGSVELAHVNTKDELADYIALTTTTCQGASPTCLLGDLEGRELKKVKLLVDYKSAITLSKRPIFYGSSKHIKTRNHFIRTCVEEGGAELAHVNTKDQLADILTKALGKVKFFER